MIDLKLPPARTSRGDRRPDGPTSVYGDKASVIYDDDESEFIAAVLRFRDVNKVTCPTVAQMLWIAKRLGYRRATLV